jgi:hypothetical protein
MHIVAPKINRTRDTEPADADGPRGDDFMQHLINVHVTKGVAPRR